ncbi:hypothetical protein O181_030128 [Austropuccinia psidii MF-1]|uniref:Helicase C-terminal domain-containing protein n=1 Tax=Austropuccinia psidii MF-1 TaxID=1389203 RepID=A0A9Q3CUX4_9BASI|nr:hypothetical protein [Austropuccinia psidii MF-1]
MLNTMEDPDLEDHEGGSTQHNSTITKAIVDVETCMMYSKIEHLLKSLLKNKQLKCGSSKLVVYSQWTQSLNLIGIVLSHHSILSTKIDGTITGRGKEKALEKYFNNMECELLIASISTSGTCLKMTCSNIVYLMVGDPQFSNSDIPLARSPIETDLLRLRLGIDSIVLANKDL